MKVSIIVATYNQPAALELILKSLNQQQVLSKCTPQDIEVIIADDGSELTTKNLIAAYASQFVFLLSHVWHEDDGFRKSIILNKAVAKAKGEYLVFLDGDCIPAPDYIEEHLKLAEAGFFVAGNRVLLSREYTATILSQKNIRITRQGIFANIMNRLLGRTNKFLVALRLSCKANWRKARKDNWRYPKGCNIGVWRDDYMAVNGYDEAFTGWGHEDADLFIRLLHLGVKIKDGRFAIPVFHLWHKEHDRKNEAANWQRVMDRSRNQQLVKSQQGVSQYVTVSTI